MTTARDALRTTSIFRFRSLTNNLNFFKPIKTRIKWHVTLKLIYKDWSKLFVRFIRNNLNQVVHNLCATRYADYTVCTTWFRLFLHEQNKNCDQSLSIFLCQVQLDCICKILGKQWINNYQKASMVHGMVCFLLHKITTAIFWENPIGGIVVNVLDVTVLDRGFEHPVASSQRR